MGCSPWGPKELDTSEQLEFSERVSKVHALSGKRGWNGVGSNL